MYSLFRNNKTTNKREKQELAAYSKTDLGKKKYSLRCFLK